jgi:hypothetical protein
MLKDIFYTIIGIVIMATLWIMDLMCGAQLYNYQCNDLNKIEIYNTGPTVGIDIQTGRDFTYYAARDGKRYYLGKYSFTDKMQDIWTGDGKAVCLKIIDKDNENLVFYLLFNFDTKETMITKGYTNSMKLHSYKEITESEMANEIKKHQGIGGYIFEIRDTNETKTVYFHSLPYELW